MKKTAMLLLGLVLSASLNFAQGVDKQVRETMVVVSTEFGDIKLKLFNETPVHRDNFLKLIKEQKYDSSIFHRIIPEFMIQGGGKFNGAADFGEQIPNEINPKYIHRKGALAAARLGDNVNPERKSSGSQFYIVQGRSFSEQDLDRLSARTGFMYSPEQKEVYVKYGGAPHLDGAYTVFGQVVEGIEVVDKIATQERNQFDLPLKEIKMTVRVVEF
jgi:cyclophilin family peptidyl-prolyl cis-trans isomerase